ncbi:uncharacterized protein [Palaemon carinicauda]|uniref:uncharacterized protein n=1 Tax=Palaemon carinicauda TaxID=392227 RepID=UPI0035B65594
MALLRISRIGSASVLHAKLQECIDTYSGVGTFPQPHSWFAHIHVDVVGPLPTSQGHRYLFTIIDCSTHWPDAILMSIATSTSCSSALLSGWMTRFGIPEHITSDRGTTFTSQLWTSFTKLLRITLHQTTAYKPAANGMAERFYCILKAALMSRCKDSNWFIQFPWVLLGLKTTPKYGLDVLTAEMVYSDPLVVPTKFLPSVTSSGNLQRILLENLRHVARLTKPPLRNICQ